MSEDAHSWPITIHRNSLVLSPGMPLRDILRLVTGRMQNETCSAAQYADLAGEEPPYAHALREIDHAIGTMKRFRAEMQRLAHHTHEWNGDDYCRVCGADGRA